MSGYEIAESQYVPHIAIETLSDTKRSHGSTSILINSEQRTPSRSESLPQSSKLRDLLRHVRLLYPGCLVTRHLPWRYETEQTKVAAY